MFLDTSKLAAGSTADNVVDPRKLFHALPKKNEKKYPYLRDVQGQVLEKWYRRRGASDLVLKMNTGSGKTVVGLLALKSSLNEGVAPAVYVCPDNYLVEQVVEEAAHLGLPVTTDPKSVRFRRGKEILVVTIKKIINGQSVFGVGDEGPQIEVGAVVIDDAHACLSATESQFTLGFNSGSVQYNKLIQLFRDELRNQSEVSFAEIEQGDPRSLMLVPYWAWLDKQRQVIEAVLADKEQASVTFGWPLVKECLQLCRCVFSGRSVEISPLCLPVGAVPSFSKATRRIFMTATLSDDSVLISSWDARPAGVAKPVTPDTASDIGDRMILVPQEINPGVYDDDIKNMVVGLSKKHNVVVIVPSYHRAEYWEDVAVETLSSKNLWDGVKRLQANHVGLVVMVNKYDGIDLPGEACRILVLDGLPEALRLPERVEKSVLLGGEAYRARQVQRIEQGMGRGVRSNDDYCVVLLNGARLTQQLYTRGAVQHFSAATRAQLQLSEQVAEQIEGQGLKAVEEAIEVCLSRDEGWVKAAKNALIDVSYPEEVPVDGVALNRRSAFEAAMGGRLDQACEYMQAAVDASNDDKQKAWLLHEKAEYMHRIDRVRSQETLAAAAKRGGVKTVPMEGVAYKALNSKAMDQAFDVAKFFREQFPTVNAVRVGVNAVLSELIWVPDTAEEFEEAWRELAPYLGFRGQRPEKVQGKGPDGLWAIGEGHYLVVSCKNGATNETIAKRYADELSGSMNWFSTTYEGAQGVPVILHPSNVFDSVAYPPEGTRVIDRERLDRLKTAARSFVNEVVNSGCDPKRVRELLVQHRLSGGAFVSTFTAAYARSSGAS